MSAVILRLSAWIATEIGVALGRRAVEVDHRDAGLVGRPDRRDHRLGVGLDDQDAVDLAADHGLDLLELLVVVEVGDALEHFAAVRLGRPA